MIAVGSIDVVNMRRLADGGPSYNIYTLRMEEYIALLDCRCQVHLNSMRSWRECYIYCILASLPSVQNTLKQYTLFEQRDQRAMARLHTI